MKLWKQLAESYPKINCWKIFQQFTKESPKELREEFPDEMSSKNHTRDILQLIVEKKKPRRNFWTNFRKNWKIEGIISQISLKRMCISEVFQKKLWQDFLDILLKKSRWICLITFTGIKDVNYIRMTESNCRETPGRYCQKNNELQIKKKH